MESKNQPVNNQQANNAPPANTNHPGYDSQQAFVNAFPTILSSMQPMSFVTIPSGSNMSQPPQPILFQGQARLMPIIVPSMAQLIQGQQIVTASAKPAQENGQPEDKSENPEMKGKGKDGRTSRVYKCTKCDKTYLSYPALYTHTKLKHLQHGETPSITNGRMRGRPRKNIVKDISFTFIDY